MTSVALFLLGTYLSIRLLAALHRVRDLWYRIRTEWSRVGASLLGWGGAAFGTFTLTDGASRTAFLAGLAAYTVFYASLFPSFALYLAIRRARRVRERQRLSG